MCLYLIDINRKELVDPEVHDSEVDSPSFHLKLQPSQVTEMMRSAFDILSVTKRCCPACHALVKYLIKIGRYKPNMLYAGAHSDWSQVCLPPFIPKKAGEAVITAAREALEPRVHRVIADQKMKVSPEAIKPWGSNMTSVASKPIATDSSPLAFTARFAEPQGMEDSANPDFLWPESKKRDCLVSSPTSSPVVRKTKTQKTSATSGSSTQPQTGESSKSQGGESKTKGPW